MTIGILLITHKKIGRALLDTATATLGFCPLATAVMAVPQNRDNVDTARLRRKAQRLARSLNQGAGVLVLTDLYGSTPSNIACGLVHTCNVRVVTGINFPMLLKVFNYPGLNLNELADKAIKGGREGILRCLPTTTHGTT